MENINKVQVLTEFNVYLCLLSAFNRMSFNSNQNWRYIVTSIVYVFVSTMIILLIPLLFTLAGWYFIESGIDFKKFVVVSPLLISILQPWMAYIGLLMKNDSLNETINQLQRVVNQRKYTTHSLGF